MLKAMVSIWRNEARTEKTKRHPEWGSEVHLEIVRAISERERRSLIANLIGWSACVAAALAMPGGVIFAVPIVWRLFSIFYVRFAWARFRRHLDTYEPYEDSLALAQYSLAVSGVFWAMLLMPIATGAAYHPLSLVILTVATIGVSLVSTMLGPLPKLLLSYYGTFTATLVLFVVVGAGQFDGWVPAFVITAGCGILAYSLGSGRENRASAENIVENRRLSYELTRALTRAEHLAERDPLTGLMNRRAFFDAYRKLARSPDAGAHVLTIDLDHFKRINDTLGHDAGDNVLIATAKQIKSVLRDLPGENHSACRFGGEEFVIYLHGLDRITAQSVAEVLRMRISDVAGQFDTAASIEVSASIGVAELADDETLDDALRRSDLAMYRAKDRGRDRVELAA